MAKKTERTKKVKNGPAKSKALTDGEVGPNLEALLAEVSAPSAKEAWEQVTHVECPYCGEDFEVPVSSEEDGHVLIEDCHVCCRPVALHVSRDEDELMVSPSRS